MSTTPHYSDGPAEVHLGDCIDVMRELPDASIDAVVTDPPYAINFMSRAWDGPGGMLGQIATGVEKRGALAYGGTHSRGYADNDSRVFQAWCETWAAECLRLLKPGGHLLAFGGTRTFHRLAAGIEDAGFEIRDSIAWLYGSGFPKSLDVSKAIDRHLGIARPTVGVRRDGTGNRPGTLHKTEGFAAHREPVYEETGHGSAAAAAWAGWGTALKPAFEPIVVARKPLAGTVAANVLAHGTGALNIDGSRIHAVDAQEGRTRHGGGIPGNGSSYELPDFRSESPAGRWPANVVLDASQAAALDAMSSDPAGGASRFFYSAKAPGHERPEVDGITHPTVKPVDLMQWLCRLVTPRGGTVLEPFAGSGSTIEAAIREGLHCIGIEREADYLPLILKRIRKSHAVGLDFGDWQADA